MNNRTQVLLAVAAVACIATNPSQQDYVLWVRGKASASSQSNLAALGFYIFGGPVLDASTTRKDFLLFSIFETVISDKTKITTVGFLRQFLPLDTQSTVRPAHVVPVDANGHFVPEEGYVWVSNPPPPGDLRVLWQAGRGSSNHPHLVSGEVEGKWVPEEGYTFNNDRPGDFVVRWAPGRASSKHPHIVSAPQEQRWLPAPGYVWVQSPPAPGDWRVKRANT